MDSVTQIVEALGGTSAVAAALARPTSTVSSWKSRGTIPAAHWQRLTTIARQRKIEGINLERLAQIAARPAA